MDEFRVIKYWTPQGEYPTFAIGIPVTHTYQNCHPLVHYAGKPGWGVLPTADSIDELRKTLQQMLAALDKPALYLSPEQLVPAKINTERNP